MHHALLVTPFIKMYMVHMLNELGLGLWYLMPDRHAQCDVCSHLPHPSPLQQHQYSLALTCADGCCRLCP